jgi:hypothetical protein
MLVIRAIAACRTATDAPAGPGRARRVPPQGRRRSFTGMAASMNPWDGLRQARARRPMSLASGCLVGELFERKEAQRCHKTPMMPMHRSRSGGAHRAQR